MGLTAPQHVGSSRIRDQTCVSCIIRWILYHWASREVLTRQLLKHKGRGLILLVYFFYHPLASQVATPPQYLGQSIIKNMKCYYRADFIRNLIHHYGIIADFQSLCTIRVPFLMLPGPGTMFKVEEWNEFGENAFIRFIHISTSVMLCLPFWLPPGIWLKIECIVWGLAVCP